MRAKTCVNAAWWISGFYQVKSALVEKSEPRVTYENDDAARHARKFCCCISGLMRMGAQECASSKTSCMRSSLEADAHGILVDCVRKG